ncbi:MAG: hypothetical protein GX284_11525 [Clostridiales bacterium]|nr:hypothetical protein [Clostridiales bacterium]
MKKFLCGLCTSLFLTYAVVAPLSSTTYNSNDNGDSPFTFYIAVEGD